MEKRINKRKTYVIKDLTHLILMITGRSLIIFMDFLSNNYFLFLFIWFCEM